MTELITAIGWLIGVTGCVCALWHMAQTLRMFVLLDAERERRQDAEQQERTAQTWTPNGRGEVMRR